jgi:hypothetical protein
MQGVDAGLAGIGVGRKLDHSEQGGEKKTSH